MGLHPPLAAAQYVQLAHRARHRSLKTSTLARFPGAPNPWTPSAESPSFLGDCKKAYHYVFLQEMRK
jgi:hypothetical protein